MDKLTPLTAENYIVGEIYYIENEFDKSQFLITNCVGIADEHRIKGRYLTNFDGETHFANEETTPYVTGRPCRLANKEERYWYLSCLAANKFVPREKAKPERIVPTEKSYIITEEQLLELYGNAFSSDGIRRRLEEWYSFDMFHEKVGGNG